MRFKVYKTLPSTFHVLVVLLGALNIIYLKICQYFSKEIRKQLFSSTDLLHLKLLKPNTVVHLCLGVRVPGDKAMNMKKII